MKRLVLAVSVLILAAAQQGCSQGRKAPPKVNVTIVNAAPSYLNLSFLRVRKLEASATPYGGGATARFDADQYDFHFQTLPTGEANPVELASFSKKLVAGNDYFFVAAETGGTVEPLIIEAPAFDPGSSDAQALIVNADEKLSSVDVYLEPSGADLTTATPLASLDFLASSAPQTRTPDDYVLTLTAAQDPATVLFQSPALTLTAGESNLFVISDGADAGLATIEVTQANAVAVNVRLDANLQSGLRVINAAADRADRDVYADSDFSAPLIGALPFGTPSSYVTLAPGDRGIEITPSGNPSAIELDTTEPLVTAVLHTLLVTGDSNGLNGTLLVEDHRPIPDAARVQFLNGATLFTALNFYLVPPGTDTTMVLPTTQIASPGVDASQFFVPGDYELTLVDAVNLTTVAGPTPVTLSAGGIYSVLAVNAANGSTADATVIDDSN